LGVDEATKCKVEEVLMPILDTFLEEVIAKSKKPELARKQIKKAPLFTEELDPETGEHTGNYVASYKKPDKFVNKKTGEEYPNTIPVWIGKGKIDTSRKPIGKGSVVCVAYTINGSKDYSIPGYYVESSKTVGLSYRLEGLSIIKRSEYAGMDCPFGDEDFGEEEEVMDDGFSHEDDAVAAHTEEDGLY
jgi:hypothetical protein